MNHRLLESHILTLEKHTERACESSKIFREISVNRLQTLSLSLSSATPTAQTPLTHKLLKNWRDRSVSKEPPNKNLFEVKRQILTPSDKTHHKNSIDQALEPEIIECSYSESSDSDIEFHKKINKDWVKHGKVMWENGIKNYDPDELFNPITTPNGKGFACDLKKIFQCKLRAFPQLGERDSNPFN
ncbi:hypothetical protein SteCoe_32193 [Stentor coeruleus]|uniref:Uncharacterized protein n=1 Tax=Stentor coeruleus TaxID=5963 RepID=A0A1R2AZR0_9CILI|nr:hypothetical protein SteCoe_32193 [Stentor coeruleus]